MGPQDCDRHDGATHAKRTTRPAGRQRPRDPKLTPTFPLKVVLHYANAKPTERSWQRVVLGPFRRHVLAKGQQWPGTLAPFGVASLAQCQKILGDFREFLTMVIAQRTLRSPAAQDLASTLGERAKLQAQGLGWDHRTKLLVQKWQTEDESFAQLPYAYLALTLREVPYTHLHRCVECQSFFFEPSKRRMRYCSERCRNRVLVREYRARHPERHREYQRLLMRRLRGARKRGKR